MRSRTPEYVPWSLIHAKVIDYDRMHEWLRRVAHASYTLNVYGLYFDDHSMAERFRQRWLA